MTKPTLPSALAVAAVACAAAAGTLVGQEVAAVVLRPGDRVLFELLAEPALVPESPDIAILSPAELTVDDEGRVLLPVAGLVQIAGRPFGEVRREVERKVAAEFRRGAVRLTPLLRIAVLGEVRAPGLFSADPTMRLADILAAAGGLTESADRGDVRLVRAGEADLVRTQAELAASPVLLRSGDRIVVGRRSWAAENLPFLIGAGASIAAALVTSLLIR